MSRAGFWPAFRLRRYYQESISLVNKLYGLKVKEKRLNQNNNKTEQSYRPDERVLAEIHQLNLDDYALYDKAVSILTTRRQLAKNNQAYVYGKTDSIKENTISGWAVNPDNAAPVKLNLIVNAHLIIQIPANQFSSRLNEINIGRNGEVGFTYTFREPLNAGDNVEVRVAGSNQLLSTNIIAESPQDLSGIQ
jgi:hypothetical protein